MQELSALIQEQPKEQLTDRVEKEPEQEQPTYLKEQASEDILNDEGDIEIVDIEAQPDGKCEIEDENPLTRATMHKISQSASEVIPKTKTIREKRKTAMAVSRATFSVEENSVANKKAKVRSKRSSVGQETENNYQDSSLSILVHPSSKPSPNKKNNSKLTQTSFLTNKSRDKSPDEPLEPRLNQPENLYKEDEAAAESEI